MRCDTYICSTAHPYLFLLYVSECSNFFKLLLITMNHSIMTGPNAIGSPTRLYELLVTASELWPVEGNYHGSYLTFRSRSGAIFAVQVGVIMK